MCRPIAVNPNEPEWTKIVRNLQSTKYLNDMHYKDEKLQFNWSCMFEFVNVYARFIYIDLTHFSLSIIIFFLHTHTLTQICFSFLFIPAAFHMFQFRTSISLLLFTALVLKSKENRNEERREEKKHFSWIINSHRKKRHSFGIGGKSGWWTMSFERNAIKSQWINDKMES